MYTFNNVEVVHIPVQTIIPIKRWVLHYTLLLRNQSLGKRLINTSATSCLRELSSQN